MSTKIVCDRCKFEVRDRVTKLTIQMPSYSPLPDYSITYDLCFVCQEEIVDELNTYRDRKNKREYDNIEEQV